VTGSAEIALLDSLGEDARFLAGWLAGGQQHVRNRLRLDDAALNRLLTCRAPRSSRFAADVMAIASYAGVDALELAGALREASTVAALRQRPEQAVGMLAAARDSTAEQLGWRADPRTRAAAKDLWAAVPREFRKPALLERIAPLAAPVAVIALPALRISRARAWLAERSVDLPGTTGDRRLSGLTYSWRGLSFVFIDGALDAAERRLTLAHELGHVVIDYIAQRARILRRAPSLLAVVDGHRALTADDRVGAALDGVPIGVQTHMLARDASGGGSFHVEDAEQRASLFALELLAPEAAVRTLLQSELRDRDFAYSLAEATRLVASAFELPPEAARARARGALVSLKRGPGFFER
jgi:hypothetical protein